MCIRDRITRRLFRDEQHLPTPVIDRGSLRAWQEAGQQDAFFRARQRVQDLYGAYDETPIVQEHEASLTSMMSTLAAGVGLDKLPDL